MLLSVCCQAGSVFVAIILVAFVQCTPVFADNDFRWPHGASAAVSLAYDDALNSQLDNAIPDLAEHGFTATFYLTLSSPVLSNRLAEWRAAAASGHELGNHSINHPCRASLPGRQWVQAQNDLDHWSIARMTQEVANANGFLHAIDGRTRRTFTPPCADRLVMDGDYVQLVQDWFVAVRTIGDPVIDMKTFDPLRTPTWFPDNPGIDALISYVETAAEHGTLASISFHGVGGDHLAVSREVHRQFIGYLARHRDRFWVDTFLNVGQYVREQRQQLHVE